MSGQFSANARPARAGSYFDFVAAQPQPVLVNTLGIVALPHTHNWGPANVVTPCQSFGEFVQRFSDGGASASPAVFTPGYIAMLEAFEGEGLPGRGGAGEVLAYRMVGSGGAAAAITLQNTTPAAAITLTAIYKGTYGQNISVAVVANALAPSTNYDLQIYVQGFLTEVFTFPKANVTALAALLTAAGSGSKWVVPSNVTSGVALATVSSPTALTGGNDGATLTGTDFTNMLAAFNVQRFGVFAYQDIASSASWNDSTGSSILTSILTWQAGLNTNGKRFTTIIGGSGADTASSASARSALAADPNVINVGVGTFADATLGNLTTSQLAPRLAGIVAARADLQGLTFARLAGVSIITGASDSDIATSLSGGGFMTLGRDSNANAPVRFEKGLTTFTVGTANMPLWVYSNPKFVITMQSIENDLADWADTNVIGQLPVDDNAVNFVLGHLKADLKDRENAGVLQSGSTVIRNPAPAPTPEDDFIAVLYGVSFKRDMEQVLNTVVVS